MASCSVCLETFKLPTTCIPCGHMFCFQCINTWCHSHCNSNKCPQCRAGIQQLQRIYLGDSSNFKIDNSKENNTLSANKLHWFHQQYNSVWFCFKRVQEWTTRYFEAVDDDNIDDDNSHTLKDYLQQQTEHLKEEWKKLQISERLMLSFGVLLVILLVVQDAQSPNGFLHALILPVLYLISNFIWSLSESLMFIFIRPVFCLWNICAELFITVFEIVYTILYAVGSTILTVLLIPCAVVCAIVSWLFVVINYFFEFVITMLQFAIIASLVGFAYLFVLDMDKREQALNVCILKYQTICSVMPKKREIREMVDISRFIHLIRHKITEQNVGY